MNSKLLSLLYDIRFIIMVNYTYWQPTYYKDIYIFVSNYSLKWFSRLKNPIKCFPRIGTIKYSILINLRNVSLQFCERETAFHKTWHHLPFPNVWSRDIYCNEPQRKKSTGISSRENILLKIYLIHYWRFSAIENNSNINL